MHSPAYYRGQAERVRRLVRSVTNRDLEEALLKMAQNYEGRGPKISKTAPSRYVTPS